MNHPNLSVGGRLALGFGLLLLVLTALVALVSYWHARSVAVQADFTDRIEPLSTYSHRLRESLLRVGIELRSYALSSSGATRAAYDAQRAAVISTLQDLRGLRKTPEGERLLAEITRSVRSYVAETDRLMEALQRGGAGGTLPDAYVGRMREAAAAPLERLLNLQEDATAAALAAMSSARAHVTLALHLSAVIAALLSLALAYFTSRSVRRPLKSLLALAAEMKAGRWQAALRYSPPVAAEQAQPAPVRNEMLQLRNAFGAAAVALESRERRLHADRELATALSGNLDTREVSGAALRAVAQHVRAEVGLVYRWNAGARLLEPVATLGVPEPKPAALGAGMPGQAALDRRTVVVSDIPADSGFAVGLGYDASPPRTAVAVPIAFGDELLGVLVVASLRRLGKRHLTFLEEAAARMSIGLKNTLSYEHVQRLYGDLQQKNDELQAQYEEIQAQHEEIQAQHEEIQSQNEELQAQREEIEAQSEQLRRQNEQLLSRTDDLDRDNAALHEADDRKNEFLGVLAHELRNPMAAISNSLLVIKRNERSPGQERKALEILERQVGHLTRIIDDLLDVTRISRGKVELVRSPFDLVQTVRDCIEDHRRVLEGKGLELQLGLPEGPIWIDGDHTRVCQILGNLLHNAIKFTASGQRIRVALEVDPAHEAVVLTVSDRGIGIEGALLPEVFKPFSQGETGLARTNAGLGLGLALVKSLVELHGGTVEARSDGPGQGARFAVRLPLAGEPVMTVKEVDPPVPARRILVVEDSVDAADSLHAVLELEGHRVESVHDADACFAALRRSLPDVVLCDIGLPGTDGYEIARRVRSDARLSHLKLIALTGYASGHDKALAAAAGFDCHLSKPLNMSELNRELRDLERVTPA